MSASAQLFSRWDVEEIEFDDRSTKRYITLSPVAHTMGRHADKQFEKSEISIVERLVNRLMQTGENTGKKEKTLGIVRDGFEEIHERTGDNPVQVLVNAVENAGPREETVTLKYGGISVPKAVDVAPQRRVDQSVKFLAGAVESGSYKTPRDISDVVADELISAASYDVECSAIRKKEEVERVAAAAR
ncbi:30S ribosomal protein S7 [Haladaptatus sp. F3-133]|uniref:Small ribosomal subunit protein uS7 n=1 Tax=Halorutilus salinus TaxID=2487751 RepID=A0A9Q4C3P2_9EURY|nr:30S ribosomal protein S7 [Halorutilus salinus]MCX2818395.1 30S ribosomal protein S7 [Halorutilus salinus]